VYGDMQVMFGGSDDWIHGLLHPVQVLYSWYIPSPQKVLLHPSISACFSYLGICEF
jgi:hypothetical protein